KSNTRGVANHGCLHSNHSFSFASYYNPERMGFGKLRVLNDDQVAPGAGFGTHPHNNMEIVSIPLSGALRHKDSEGNKAVIKSGEVQIMSAGTGVYHSEYNNSYDDDVNFLQIWVMPEKMQITPRYDQKFFEPDGRYNKFQTVVSPLGTDEDSVKINQQSYFSLLDLDGKEDVRYDLRQPGNGAYVFVLEGDVKVGDENLSTKDGLGIEDASQFTVTAKDYSRVLVIEVPMS
ncbi:MAG: pirin family protein, partial [Bdellovibrionales bacterium]|nr:pirin family protein [Bdellovibrionales bacterium]NQZ17865.1 pirin family protein [Bdellovibrionales bacterium]